MISMYLKQKKKYEMRINFIQALIKRGKKCYAQRFYGDLLYNIKIFLKLDPEKFFDQVSSLFMPYIFWKTLTTSSKVYEVPLALYPDKRRRFWARRFLKLAGLDNGCFDINKVTNEYLSYGFKKTNKIIRYNKLEILKACSLKGNIKQYKHLRRRWGQNWRI